MAETEFSHLWTFSRRRGRHSLVRSFAAVRVPFFLGKKARSMGRFRRSSNKNLFSLSLSYSVTHSVTRLLAAGRTGVVGSRSLQQRAPREMRMDG